jgi:hypothetical protein
MSPLKPQQVEQSADAERPIDAVDRQEVSESGAIMGQKE